MAFDPSPYLMNLKGKQYLPVQARLLWFREEHPDGDITTELVRYHEEDKMWVVRALVTVPGGGLATGHKQETERDFPAGALEKAECVPLRSEILTRQGFKYFDQITVGDDVLAYDKAADRCAWTPLRAINVFPTGDVVRLANKWGFRFDCTRDHSWPIETPSNVRKLLKTSDLKKGQAIIVAAAAEDGDSPITPEEAAILGWVFTDGTVKRQGRHVCATITQSKPMTVTALCQLVGALATETVGHPTTRTFPTGKTYACLPAHKFMLPAPITRALFEKAGITDDADLPALACRLTAPARRAMFEAMMQADGDARGNFGKKRRPGTMDAWQILATLEGHALGAYIPATGNRVPLQRLRKGDRAWVESLDMAPLNPQPVWCPTTDYGTWVMRQDGNISITGNTGAIGRALAALGYGTAYALELDEGERVADSPVQPARPARSAQAGLKVVADRPTTAPDQTTLRDEVTTGLAADPDAAAKLPKEASTMTAEELEKTLAWLRNRATRRESAQGSGATGATSATVTDSFSVARDKRAAFARQITEVVVSDLNALASTIVASHDQGDVVTSAQGKEMLECVDLAQRALEAQRAGQLAQVELAIGQAKKSAQIGADFYDALIALTRRIRTERTWATGVPAPATTRAVAS